MNQLLRFSLKCSLVLAFGLLVSGMAVAQESYEYLQSRRLVDNWSVSGSIGLPQLMGSMSANNFSSSYKNKKDNFCYQLNFTKHLNPFLAVQGQFDYSNFGTTLRKARNDEQSRVYYDLGVTEYGLNLNVNLSNLIFGRGPLKNFSIYGIAGIGIVSVRNIKKDIFTNEVLGGYGFSDDAAITPGRMNSFVVPLGLGITYELTKHLDFNIESSIRSLNLDKLDMNKTKTDKLIYTSVGLRYKINVEFKVLKLQEKLSLVDKIRKVNHENKITRAKDRKVDSFKKHSNNWRKKKYLAFKSSF